MPERRWSKVPSDPLLVFDVRSEDGMQIKRFTTTSVPPKIGETLNLQIAEGFKVFEVLKVSHESVLGYEIVVVTVKRVEK